MPSTNPSDKSETDSGLARGDQGPGSGGDGGQ